MRKLIQVIFGALLIILVKFVPTVDILFLHFNPFYIQSIAVYFIASVFGTWSSISVLIIIFLASVGFPVLYGNIGGFEIFLLPSTGFVCGWLGAVLIIGYIRYVYLRLISPKNLFAFIFFLNLLGAFVCFVVEVLYFMALTQIPTYLVIDQVTQFVLSEIFIVLLASISASLTLYVINVKAAKLKLKDKIQFNSIRHKSDVY